MTNIGQIVDDIIADHSAIDDFFDVDENLIPEVTKYLKGKDIDYNLLRCGNIYSLVFYDKDDVVYHYMFRVGYIEKERRNA